MKVDVSIGHYYFKVFIDGVIHVCIDRNQFIGVVSWYDCETQCSIKWITKTNNIKTEYDSVEKWKQVLKAINDNL